MSGQPIDESAVFARAKAPVTGISMPRHLGYGTDLCHALDFVVLTHVMFNVAEGREVGPMQVWKELQARGIRSAKNAGELVGKNAVYESFGRLIAAGYLRRYEEPNARFPGRKGRMKYEVYDNPAWNPNWQAAQAGTDPLTATEQDRATRPGNASRDAGTVESGSDVSAGQNASRDAGSDVDGSGVPGSVKRRVPAGQNASRVPGSIDPSPPHPPEEVDTSSPYPLTGTSRELPSQREEEAEFSLEEISDAERFLQRMSRWQAGAATARKCAPRLLRAMKAQGWPRIAEMDDALQTALEAEIFKNTRGAVSWAKCLPGWIDDLRLYELAQARPGTARGASCRERCPDHPGRYRTGCIDCAMAVPT